MRFERIRIDAFGRLRELDTGAEALPSLVVVHGHNEAGKTTFFHFIGALLYGFYPANRDANPFTPWEEGVSAEGGGVVRLDDGTCAEVRRRLLSSPAASVLREGSEEALRNRTVPWAQHVPRGIYDQVFALTLSELAALDVEGWDVVQERLLGGLGSRDLRPVRQVLETLESDAGALWRPNRRGNQEVRRLGERMRELRLRRNAARDTDRRMRAAHAELDQARDGLESARAEREACRESLERARIVQPLRARLARLRELEDAAGAPDELDGLPPNPPERLRELRDLIAQAARRRSELEAERSRWTEAAGAFGERHERLLARRGDVEGLAARAAASEQDRVLTGQLDEEIRGIEARLEGLRARIPGAPADDALRALDPDAVRDALETWHRARDELERLEGRPSGHSTPALPGWAAPAATLLGVILLTVGMATGRVWLVGVGAALAAAGSALWLADRPVRRPASWPDDEAAARARLERAGETLATALDGASAVPGDRPPPRDLGSRVERAQELVRDRDLRRARLDEARQRLAALDADTEALWNSLAPGDADGGAPLSPAARLHLLRQALDDAVRRREEGTAARRELERLDREADRLASEEGSLRLRLERLEERCAAAGGGDVDEGARVLAGRMRALSRALELRDELDASHPDAERLARADAPDPERVPALRAREQSLTEAIESLAGRVRSLETELSHLSDRTTLDDLDGEIRVLEEERHRLERERDRLWILARVLRDADRWVREEHQPEVLRKAGAYLDTVTGGRWTRIVMGGDEGRTLMVRGPRTEKARVAEPPISTGTLEQVYLALRLALLGPLEGGGERLPLVLDEVLVNWDPVRRDRGLDLVARVAAERQVFFLTCHPDLVTALERRGARVLKLGAP